MPSAIEQHALLPERPYASYREYLQAVGESAVELARRSAPEDVVAEIQRAGLRGRGGAGFPTGVKWRSVAQSKHRIRFVVMNAAEGEPGTFKDRALLRRNPYAALEGLLVAQYAVQAKDAYVAIKRSFLPELGRLRAAVEEMQARITIVEGPDEYLFGEEKALLEVIDGGEPLPRPPEQPPYEWGIQATPIDPHPTLVNNVETYAHASTILRHGADSFRQLGTPDTPGTILVTLSGDLQKPGIYEHEAGVPVRRILEESGGGPRSGRSFRALLSGVSTGVLVPEKFDTPADFGSMALAGSGLGSAGFILIDDATSVPRVAQSVARFLFVESCNQCSACKAGLRLASRAIDELFDPATATPDDPERALYGARSAPQGNRCYLPVQGSILIPDLLSKFRADIEAQLAHPERPTKTWLIPKFVDYDEDKRKFAYDVRQTLKQPDWTYRTPPAPLTSAVGVRLAPDLRERLEALAETAGLDLDRQVDAALREWLRGRAESG